MANGRNPKKFNSKDDRDGGGFVAIPFSVLDSRAYKNLSHPAKALLMELSRQFVRNNNGRLLCSMKFLKKRGWNSADVITRAKRELLAAGLIHETVMGHRPNKASWYAVTWRGLDTIDGYDPEARITFQRGAYRDKNLPIKNTSLKPLNGIDMVNIAPFDGIGPPLNIPCDGAISIKNQN